MEPGSSQWVLNVLRERERLQRHFVSVERELRAGDVCPLTRAQRLHRNRILGFLREYRMAGRFPVNTEVPNERAPYLQDLYGTPCAMAYLIERAGDLALVNSMAAQDNHVCINDVANGPLLDWLEEYGLRQDEAARIQPSYGWNPPPLPNVPPPALPPVDPSLLTAPLFPGAEIALVALGVSLGVLVAYLLWRDQQRMHEAGNSRSRSLKGPLNAGKVDQLVHGTQARSIR